MPAMLEIAALRGIATVQDGGRTGHMHEGVPPGGPLVPELLARANAALGNADDDAAVELVGAMTLAAAGHEARIATSEGEVRTLREGERWELGAIEPPSASGSPIRYVAVRGGVDVPVVLGGRGTLVVARMGGLDGRPLRRGDRLPIGARYERCGAPRPLPAAPDTVAPVRVVLGPDFGRFPPRGIETLLASEFRVHPRSDRVGLRLDGPLVPRTGADSGASRPMLRGAIQVPPSGELVVLGPDHPTIGGYPVVATVVRADWGSLWARSAGASVRFAACV